jgi:TPR repeat protein
MEALVISKLVAFCALVSLTAPLLAEQEETFTEITPGLEAADPNKLVPLAEKGDPRAMNNLGLLWARGVGVPAPDFQEALRWWKGAAKRGYPLAMNNIGLLYANGQGVKQDYKEAFKWWEMSSEQGNAWAMNSIGDLYENGQGVERSYAEAMDWYQRAAEAGDGLAMYNIGALYENGRGVPPNFKTAMDWYERSADKGIATAMLSLGKLLSEGRGVPVDPAEAHAWFSVAAGYFTAEDKDEAGENAKLLSALTPTLSEKQMERAREIVHNLQVRIEERRRAKPLKAGPGESET